MTVNSVAAISFLIFMACTTPLLAAKVQAETVNSSQRPTRVNELCNKGDKDEIQESITVKSSKSNSSERLVVPPPTAPAEKSNLNLSKSNVDRKRQEQDPCEVADPEK